MRLGRIPGHPLDQRTVEVRWNCVIRGGVNAGERIIAPLGANVDRRPALGGGDDIRELQKAGVPVVSLRQDGLDYFDTHHTADDTLDKIDPKQLDQAVAVWSAFTYLAAASDVDFRSLGRN